MARPGKYLRARRGTVRASAALLVALSLPAARPAASRQRLSLSSGENRILARLNRHSSFLNLFGLRLLPLPQRKGHLPESPPSGRRPLAAKVSFPASSLSTPYLHSAKSLTFRLPGGDTVSVVVDGVNRNGSGDAATAAAAISGFRNAFATRAETYPNATPKTALIAAILATDQELRQRPDTRFASLTAVFHHGSRATVASVGGSAALLVRSKKVSLLTSSSRRVRRTNERSPRLGEGDRSRDGMDLMDDFGLRIEEVQLEPGDRIVVGSPGLGQLAAGRETSVIERIEELIRRHDERTPGSDFAPLLAKLASRDGLVTHGDNARHVVAVLMSFSEPAQK